jgi:hypothetical protein
MKEIHKQIAIDLNTKIKAKNITKYHLHKTLNTCSEPTLLKILRGNGGKTLPWSIIVKIYRALGETEININKEELKLFVRL